MASAKKLPPSQKRLTKAREEGDVARSTSLSGAIRIAGLAVALASGIHLIEPLFELTHVLLQTPTALINNKALSNGNSLGQLKLSIEQLRLSSWTLAKLLLPILSGLFVLSLLSEVGQVGIQFSMKPLSFSLSKLNPVKGLKRMFGIPENDKEESPRTTPLHELAKTLVLLVAYFALSLGLFLTLGVEAMQFPYQKGTELLAVINRLVLILLSLTASLLLVASTIELVVQKHRRWKRLHMDVEEFKREMRESEGDPELKGMRKQLHQEISMNNLVQSVRKAKVLIVGK